jgi:hypothetical protein
LKGTKSVTTAEATLTHAGALDALANYWITRVDYETRAALEQAPNTPEDERYDPRSLPESNLRGSANDALYLYSKVRGCSQKEASARASGFQVGFEVALALSQAPLNAEARIKAILDKQFAE